jgi:hypothetical protein
MPWESEEEEKKDALDSWIESTEEEIEFAKSIYKFLDKSTTKKEFLGLAEEKLHEYKNPWIKNTLQSILNLVTT